MEAIAGATLGLVTPEKSVELLEAALRATTARLALLESLATAANEAAELNVVLDLAIAKLCEHTGWACGRAYLPAEFGTAEELVTEARTCDAAVWNDNALAFPVRVGSEVASVLAFFGDGTIAPDEALFHTIELVATQLSRVAERERASKELAAARDAAMESSRMKSEFMAAMSHEIRTPMNGLIGLTGLLLSTDLDDRQLQYAEGVESAGRTLLSIINDILDLSQIEAGRFELDECDFDLVQVMEEAVSLVALTTRRKGLELVCAPDLELPPGLRGDPARLRQVLLNLTANAAKFTSEGEIVVRASLEAELDSSVIVRFHITDTGIGIAEDVRVRLFEPFSHADASTTRKYGGTGLGLATCRQLVAAMGGEIGVESELGKGSDFWFTVPLRRQSRGGAVLALTRPDLKVLVADANAAVRAVLCERLQSWGVLADEAADGVTALDAVRAATTNDQPYDLVLVDELLVNHEGAPIVDAIETDRGLSRARIVTLTRDATSMRATPPRDRMAASLTKPVRVAQLREILAFPLQGRSVPNREATPLNTRTEARGHVLVVEDSATDQLVAVGILRFLGYRADVAANGYEALEAMVGRTYDAVLMDCQMPEMDGYTTIKNIRKNESASGRHTPVIGMTAGATDIDRDRCLASGMDDYVGKPVKTEQIEAALRKWTMPAESTAAR